MTRTALRTSLLTFAALALAAPLCPASAQTTTAPAAVPAPMAAEPTPEAMRLAKQIIAKTSANREASIQAMARPMVGMLQQFGIHEQDRAKVLVDEVLTPMLSAHIDELFALQARSYALTLSVDDLKGLDAFYDTPAGRDTLALQPQLSSNLISNTTQWLHGLSPELQSKMQAAIKAHGWDEEPAAGGMKKQK